MELPSLIKRCLAYGIKIYPYQLDVIMQQYYFKNIPDIYLNDFDKNRLQKYIDGLYLSAQEMARDWSKGHEMLKELGFQEKVREEGHRLFVSLEYTA